VLVPADVLMAPIIPIINFKINSLYIPQGSMEIIRDEKDRCGNGNYY